MILEDLSMFLSKVAFFKFAWFEFLCTPDGANSRTISSLCHYLVLNPQRCKNNSTCSHFRREYPKRRHKVLHEISPFPLKGKRITRATVIRESTNLASSVE